MAIATFQVSPQGDGSFNVEMTTAGGQFRTIPGFSSEHEAAAWIVQTRRLLQQANPRLKDRVPAVPESDGKAQTLSLVADAGDTVFTPVIGAGPRLIVSEVVPGIAVFAVVFPDGSPLALAEAYRAMAMSSGNNVIRPADGCANLTPGTACASCALRHHRL